VRREQAKYLFWPVLGLKIVNGELAPPRVIGRYALYDTIATGGMATVHLGRLLGSVGFARTVAIKRLHAQFAGDPEFVSMFLDEARLVARISHPNVVPTLDVVSTEGELFLVMEYVHGESVARLSRAARQIGTRMPPEMVVAMMVGVLHGLHAAHEASSERGEPLGIVHRDVSPQNILVGVDGVARVLDFGVAKSAGRMQASRDGQLKGKLSYMAPEQVRGKVSRTTDVYAASIVLWEALTGKRLFDGQNEGQIFDRVLKGCQTAPSTVVTDLPRALDDVTMRGLCVSPAKRFQTAREMARALEDAVHAAPASKIGEWVESMSHDQLAERRKRIAVIESESATEAPLAPSERPPPRERVEAVTARSPAASPGDEPRAETGTSVPLTEDVVPTQLSTASVSAPGREASASRRGTRIAIGALLTAVAGIAVVAIWPHHPTNRASSPPAATVPGDSAAIASSALPVTVAAPAPRVQPVASATVALSLPSVVPSAPASSLPSGSPPRRQTSTAVPASTPAAPSKSHCNPPWTTDSRGVRSFKKECF
jgi:eukaryotic-like serine/threonine-protein kinase